MSEPDWKQFWANYRGRSGITGPRDLFFEVGKTIAGEPISEAAFALSLQLVVSELELTKRDRLLELCCGNGLMTLPLASVVEEVCAVDFAAGLIAHGREFRNAPNITYHCDDAVECLRSLSPKGSFSPTKILLGEALGYFTPSSLRQMLQTVQQWPRDAVPFLASGIPCDDLKWNFYNTPERRRRYEENQLQPGNANDGIGRWWGKEELLSLGRELSLEVTLHEQPPELSNFRIDACFSFTR